MKARLTIVLLIVLLSLTAFILLIPTIASTRWGQTQVVSLINHYIPGRVEIRRLHLRWGEGQLLEGVTLKDPQGEPVLNFDRLSTEASLWQIITKSTRLGHTELIGLNASIATDKNGVSNLQKALGITTEAYKAPLPARINLSRVHVDLNLFNRKMPFMAHLTGSTQQGELTGTFDIRALLKGFDANNWEELAERTSYLMSVEGSKDAQLQAKVVNFPVDLLDQFVALKNPDLNGIFRRALGDKINITLDKEPSSEGLAFNLSVLAPLMQGNVKGKIAEDKFLLQTPAIFHFNLTPDLIQLLAGPRLQLLESTRLQVTVDALNVPLAFLTSENPVDPCAIHLKANSSLQPTKINLIPMGPLNISDFKAFLDSPACDKNLLISAAGQVTKEDSNGQKPFPLKFEAALTKPTTLKQLYEQLKKESRASLQIKGLPISLLQSFIEPTISLQEALGSYANANVEVNNFLSKEMTGRIDLATNYLKLNPIQFKLNDELALTAPLKGEYIVQPTFIASFDKNQKTQLANPFPVIINIKELHIPLENPKEGRIQANLAASSFDLSSSFGMITMQQAQAQLGGLFEDELTFNFTSKGSITPSQTTDLPLLKGPYDLNVVGQLNKPDNGKDRGRFRAQLKAEQASIQADGKLTATNHLKFDKPVEIHYHMTPAALQALQIFDKPHHPKLRNEPEVVISAEPFEIDLSNFELEKMAIKGLLSVDKIVVQQSSNVLASIDQLMLHWELDGPRNFIHLNLKGTASTNQDPKSSALLGRVSLQEWLNQGRIDLSHVQIQAVTQLTGIPTSFLNTFVSELDLTSLLGPTIDIGLTTLFDRDRETPGYWDMHINSALLHAKARLKFGEAITLHISQNNPGPEIRWTLTPQSYQTLRLHYLGTEGFDLVEPLVFTGTVSELYLPLNQPSLLVGGRIKAQFSTNQVRLHDSQTKQTIPLKIDTQLTSENLQQNLLFSMNAFSKESAQLMMSGSIAQFLNQPEPKDWKQANLAVNIKAQQIPVTLLPSYQKHLQALIGDILNGEFALQWNRLNGPISGFVKGNRGQAQFKGQLTHGILTLSSPLEAQIKVTPLLSDVFLNRSLPILSTALGSDRPIQLTIEPQGFSVPLIPFNLQQSNIPKGTLDLGKVYFKNEGNLKQILSMIKPIEGDQVSVWFTPLYFQMAQGRLYMKRIDMLVGQEYSLASWGEINAASHKADIVLGIGARALQYAFGIQGLDPDYMLQIPIKGRNGHMEIDKSKAAARISALIAQTRGGSKGKLIGSILEIAASGSEDPKAPAPTTQPFPWAHLMTPEAAANSQSNTVPSQAAPQKKEDNLINLIEEGFKDPKEESPKHSSKKKHKKKHGLKKAADQLLKELENNGPSLIDGLLGK